MKITNSQLTALLVLLVLILWTHSTLFAKIDHSGGLYQRAYIINSDNHYPVKTITSLFHDQGGILWIGTGSGLLQYQNFQLLSKDHAEKRFDRSIVRVQKFVPLFGRLFCVADDDLFEISGGKVEWVAGLNEPIQKLYKDMPNSAVILLERLMKNENINLRVSDLASIRWHAQKAHLYLLLNSKLYYTSAESEKIMHLKPLIRDGYHQTGDSIITVSAAEINIFTHGELLSSIALPDSISAHGVALRAYNAGKSFFLNAGPYIFLLQPNDPDKEVFRLMINDPRLTNIKLEAIAFLPEENMIYVASVSKGLWKYTALPIKSLPLHNVVSISKLAGKFLIRTGESELAIATETGAATDHSKHIHWNIFRSPGGQYITNLRHENGLARLDSTGKITKVVQGYRAAWSAFAEDDSRNIYFVHDATLLRLNPENQISEVVGLPYHYDSIFSASIHYANDTIRITSENTGLLVIDLNSHTLYDELFFKDKNARFVFSDQKSDAVYITTYGYGIWKMNGSDIQPVPLDRNEHLRFAHHIVFDRKNRVWITSNAGLFVADYDYWLQGTDRNLKGTYYWRFVQRDGLPDIEFNGFANNSYWLDHRSQQLHLANLEGMVTIDLDAFEPSVTRNNASFISIKDQNQITVKNFYEALNFERIEVQAALPVMPAFMNSVIMYRFPPSQTDWQHTENGYFVIKRTKPGVHNLEIKYRYGFGENDFVATVQPITIKHYWHESLPNRIALFVLGFALIILIIWLRVKSITRSKIRLNRIVMDQTKLLSEQLNALNKSREINNLLSGVVVHDLKNSLFKLQLTLQKANEALKDHQWSESEELINSSINRLDMINHHINKHITWVMVKRDVKPVISKSSVQHLIQEVVKKASTLYNNKSLRIIAHGSPSSIMLETDTHLLSLIIMNLLDNAIKHTPEDGLIKVTYEVNDTNLSITVSDSGAGMTDETIDKIMNSEKSDTADYKSSFGMGYVIIRDFLHILNGSFYIHKPSKSGTSVTITVPAAISDNSYIKLETNELSQMNTILAQPG